MSEQLTVKAEALEPLFASWEEPSAYRSAKKDGSGAEVMNGRRPTQINGGTVERIRRAVRDWRAAGYAGASDTSQYLLEHWFGRSHAIAGSEQTVDFRYYFCQREAVETLVYLWEVRQL